MRTLATGIVIALFTATSFSQGLLVETAADIFRSLMLKSKQESTIFSHANFSEVEEKGNVQLIESFEALKSKLKRENFNSYNVESSFTVSSLDISFEADLTSEAWMEETLSNDLELVEVENWMTTSFSESIEHSVVTESWMTQPLSESLMETSPEAEDWMIESFTSKMEMDIQTENWMEVPFHNQLEERIETEEWMISELF